MRLLKSNVSVNLSVDEALSEKFDKRRESSRRLIGI